MVYFCNDQISCNIWFMRCIKIYLLNKHSFIMVINGKKVSREATFWSQMYIFKPVLSAEQIRQVKR